MDPDYKNVQSASCGYSFKDFHPTCKNVGLMLTDDGVKIYCRDCRVIADLEAVGTRVCNTSAKAARPAAANKVGGA